MRKGVGLRWERSRIKIRKGVGLRWEKEQV